MSWNVAAMDFVTFTDFFRYLLNKSCATLTDVPRNVPCSAILSFQDVKNVNGCPIFGIYFLPLQHNLFILINQLMKRKSVKTIVCLALSACVLNSCVGSFGLFNKLAQWNKDATDVKILNELIFLVISPAYVICGAADVLVLNTIEFWTGDNPVASNVGKTKQVMGSDGLMYAVTYLKDGYEIKNPNGEVVEFVYDKKEKTWSMETEEGRVTLLKVKDKNTAEITLKNGQKMDVALNAQGLYEARMAMGDGMYFATR